jgi:beta-glucosidase
MNTIKFPSNFFFGVADADLQVIGEKYTIEEEGSLPTMWLHDATNKNFVHNNDSPAEGIDRFHKFEEDIELISKLGSSHYRTSISMARMLTADKKVNPKAVNWYKNYFTKLEAKGVTVQATLYHWELPQFLSEKGGWANREAIDFFVEHAKATAQHLGEHIDEYFLINEHICVVFLGYYLAMHAPFEADFGKALQAGHNLLVAQGLAFREIKKINPNAKVSTVYNPAPVYAASMAKNDLLARENSFGLNSDWLLEPIFTGKYPENMTKVFEQHLPKVEPGDMDAMKIGADLHALGLNYYFGQTVAYDENSVTKSKGTSVQYQVTNGLGWPVYAQPAYPTAFKDLLLTIYNKYQLFGLNRIYITENGTAWPSDVDSNGIADDQFRISYLQEHLSQVSEAIRAGVPIEGYYLWTLMDNYEWQEGYRKESSFGLVHIDRQTMKRTPKKSFYWYQDFIRTSRVEE